ncbi:hypothetical protein [Nocardia terpenica]|uniref:SMP-30/Gluconolactonase/LRE-like region domain-containing protein n=1 Tax=Nocardia terpenica TaxID=455432 RepID=A0A6G9ZEI9_9NOCA|nr:hypothetical protein [Nocardia terpenica]QIS23413.1 hypothetical protein F6W96_38885 [Nocardia terpenica]
MAFLEEAVYGFFANGGARCHIVKALANEALSGVSALAFTLTDATQGPLNQKGINALRAFPGQGPLMWGARTLAAESDSDWRYLNVRPPGGAGCQPFHTLPLHAHSLTPAQAHPEKERSPSMTATRGPGVRVTERPGGSRTLAGAGTSIAAFLGTSLYGPTTPTLVRSWTEYLTLFGSRGTTAEPVAGNGTAGTATVGDNLDGNILNSPRHLAFGTDGQLYISQMETTHGLLVADLTTRRITRCVTLRGGAGVAARPDGGVLLSQADRHCVYSIPADGTPVIVAGQDGSPGSTGDEGPATNAKLNIPVGIAWQDDGSWLIAAAHENRIRRVDAGGIITTVAGTGIRGFEGDGGPATSAQLMNPYGVCACPGGGFYIADTYGHRVRYVDPNGIITTVAGNGLKGSRGDGGLPRNA